MKTSDIPDADFLVAVQEIHDTENRAAFVGDLEAKLSVPFKLVLSKARRLINREVLDGCWCGCRGDFEIPGWERRRS